MCATGSSISSNIVKHALTVFSTLKDCSKIISHMICIKVRPCHLWERHSEAWPVWDFQILEVITQSSHVWCWVVHFAAEHLYYSQNLLSRTVVGSSSSCTICFVSSICTWKVIYIVVICFLSLLFSSPFILDYHFALWHSNYMTKVGSPPSEYVRTLFLLAKLALVWDPICM